MSEAQTAFQIDPSDNVATALVPLAPGPVALLGDRTSDTALAVQEVPQGHKLALRDLTPGETILKYGVSIGRATQAVAAGSWVHLHCMESCYDERSSHLDVVTGAPKDISYE